ncbi:MAG TPA: AAA family ATPase, partial [Myxococcaceae bacterium]|nr:AAA family ATPase [Myxococcaceae bacterium]
STPHEQHAVMIEAVENHMPEAIIVDEIGTELEAHAARTIAERGVQLVATAHGNTLENLVLNPILSDLVGGVATVTLSDEEARRRGTLKTVSERRARPTFDMVVELLNRDDVIVHRDTTAAVDALLAGKPIPSERRMQRDGQVHAEEVTPVPAASAGEASGVMRIHVYGLNRDVVQRAARSFSEEVRLVSRPEAADLLLVLRSRAGDPRIRRALQSGAPVQYLKRASAADLRRAIRAAVAVPPPN